MFIILLLVSPIIVLLYLIEKKNNRCKKLMNEFNRNKKAIDDINIVSDYKIGKGHLYE